MKRPLLITTLFAFGLAFPAATSADEGSASVKTTYNARVGVIGKKPVVEYRFTDVAFKPYVKTFTTPGGLNVLRDSPADHVHHHALMFAVKVDGVNFWEEFPDRKPGKQVHARFLSEATASQADGVCSFDIGSEQIDWKAADGRTLLEETRQVRVQRPSDAKDGSVLTWTTRLAVPEGRDKAVLTGSHYHGLGVRFPKSMDRVGTHFNAAGRKGSGVPGKRKVGRNEMDCLHGARRRQTGDRRRVRRSEEPPTGGDVHNGGPLRLYLGDARSGETAPDRRSGKTADAAIRSRCVGREEVGGGGRGGVSGVGETVGLRVRQSVNGVTSVFTSATMDHVQKPMSPCGGNGSRNRSGAARFPLIEN